MPLTAGDKLGHYEVLAPIGAGGMGEVYRARDTQLERDAAIKVLPRALASEPDRLARFDREAKILAALNHPNIAVIYGLVEAEGQRALAMELVPGETLLDRMKHGPIPLEEILPIARQIAEALEAAHERGVIHRDLKPANVMITPAGMVKVLDFGLAAMAQPGRSASSDPVNSPTLTMGMTQAGVIMGTASYMAPEQAAGTAVDKRADIWSFGVVLFEMLSGTRLFDGDTVAHTLADVLRGPIDFEKVTTPTSLKNLLRRCLDRNVSTRLRDIGEARIALQNPISEEAPAPSTSPGAAKKPSLLWAIVAALSLVLAAGTLAFTFLRPAPVAEVTRFEIHAPPGTTLPLGTPAVSPDGRTIAFTATDKQQIAHLYVRRLDSLDARLLPGTENALHPFFSPDGRSLAFASTGRTLMRIDLAGGAPRVLADLTGPWHGSWGPSGTILFQAGGITQVSASGGPPAALADGGFPFFLPDGKRFLTYINAPLSAKEGGKDAKPHIELAGLGSKEHTLVLDDAGSAAIPTPTPGGALYLLYARGANVMAQPLDPSSGKLLGEPTAILDDVGRVANPALMPTLGVSPSGTLAFQKSKNQVEGRLTWYDRAGKPLGELASQAVGRGPVLSPDGQFAAVIRMDPSALAEDIWVVDLKRGTSSRLTFAKERDRVPVWSADGKRITFNRDGVGVFEKDASGAGAETLVLPDKAEFTRSPDGKYLIRNEGGGKAVLVPLPADAAGGKNPIPVGSANGRNQNFEFSPDGRCIAYVSNESGNNQVYVQPTPPGTGRWQISVGGGAGPHWRRDGKELFFYSGEELMAVDVTLRDGSSFSAGPPHSLFRVTTSGGYAVTADGQRFLVHSDQSAEEDSPIIVVQNWWAALRK